MNDQRENDSQTANEPVIELGLGAAWDLDQNTDDSQTVREVHDDTNRALALGIDSAGGYAVPYQLDGKKKKGAKIRPSK